ncbi:MAG: shikimate dehydrogenase [Candidatus Binataceae bacterium]
MKRARPPAHHPKAIGSTTKIAAVFGDPVEHSLSPAMHNAAYAALGMDRIYVACQVKTERLAAAIRSIAALGLIGVNLTTPHKQLALRVVKNLSDEARVLGAANCIVNRGGELYGDNTDARGLERAIRELGLRIAGRDVMVIGAGGAAAATVLALQRLKARRIVIANRTPARAHALARRLPAHDGSIFEARGLDALNDRSLLASAALILNATPMGLVTSRFVGLDYGATSPNCIFQDLIYAPEPTPFLAPALAVGRRTFDGTAMLLHQGLLAFRLFNGVAAPAEAMRDALLERLGHC